MIPVEPSSQTHLARKTTASIVSRSNGSTPGRIGILSNLRAGQSDAHVPRLRSFLTAHPDVVHVETHAPDEVPEALSDLADQDVELLLLYGGDGTLQRVLTEILGDRRFGDRVPMIAPLRGGRTNLTALEIGTQRDPVQGIADVLKAVETGRLDERLSPRHVLHVTSQRGDVDEYGMIFGGGTIYRAVELVHRSFPTGRAQGVFGSTVVLGGLLLKRAFQRNHNGQYTRDKIQIFLDDQPAEEDEYLLVITSTLRHIFLRIRPFWGQEPAPVCFTSVATGARRFALAIPRLLSGKPGGSVTPERGYTSRNLHQVELHLDCGFVIDGELTAPEENRILTITADDCLDFVRA